MTTNTTTDLETIAADPQTITLTSGLRVNVLRLKTRQLMRLMKILTRGGAPALAEIQLSADMDPEAFAAQMLALMAFSIPEAEEETIEFVLSMIEPAELIPGAMSKPEREVNEGLYLRVNAEMVNPELDDLISVIEVVVKTEAPHLVALGKRLRALVAVATPTKKPEASPTSRSKRRASSTRRSSAA